MEEKKTLLLNQVYHLEDPITSPQQTNEVSQIKIFLI